MSLKLGVNVDHVATLREARYRGRTGGEPDPVALARQCEVAGAHGITAHLREDRRHILDRDLAGLREALHTRLNLEMANTPEMVAIAVRLRPAFVCIVPEKRMELTTEGGLDAAGQVEAIGASRRELNQAGVEVSLFIDPDPAQVRASAQAGAQYVELHTGPFAEAFADADARKREVARLVESATLAHQLGLRVNAGHGLTTANVPGLFEVPHLDELNIGHSIISRAVFIGIHAAVKEMLEAMQGYKG